MKIAMVGCFFGFLAGKKKTAKESLKPIKAKRINSAGDLRVKPEELYDPTIEKGLGKVKSVEDSAWLNSLEKSLPCNSELLSSEKNGNLVRADSAADAAYEGEDEYDENFSMKRDFSDFDLHALAAQSGENYPHEPIQDLNTDSPENNSKGTTPEVIQSGHVSDPGIERTTSFLASPMLKRSCSNIETNRASTILEPPIKSNSHNDLENYSGNAGVEAIQAIIGSPLSVITSCSADKIMLKKGSSSQVLPSRSRKLWWKLFLWSHRNLHRPCTSKPVQRMISMNNSSHQKGGYCSDTLEPKCVVDVKKKKAVEESEIIRNDIWPQNQWVAFSAESSSLDRVDAWVHSLDDSPFCGVGNSENIYFEAAEDVFCSTEIGESSNKNHNHNGRHTLEEVVQANTIIHSLNSVSSVAHIAGMGLKVIPPIAPFTSLRSVNLSGNFIVHISPGSLPKSLHTLDLSRNKIATIDGLRDLTRLRILNLSYNRISRIGHGLSNCVVIKELYLAGNKISGVEGLHRLLKLTVLDLSFNKISTAKALGQLVANYNSLLAVNLLGNPIQSNIGDEQLRKAAGGLLPNLAYLNKQPIKPQRAREVATDSVAKAALGSSGWSSRRATRRVTQSSAASVKGSSYRGLTNVATKNSRHKSKRRHQPSTCSKK